MTPVVKCEKDKVRECISRPRERSGNILGDQKSFQITHSKAHICKDRVRESSGKKDRETAIETELESKSQTDRQHAGVKGT